MRTSVIPIPAPISAAKAAAARYLSCLRLQEILVLQGSPLLGAAFAIRHPTMENVGPLAILTVANVCLVAHIFMLNDWSGLTHRPRRPQQGRRRLHGQRRRPQGDRRSDGRPAGPESPPLQPPRPQHLLPLPGHRHPERALLPAPLQLERQAAPQLSGPPGRRRPPLPPRLLRRERHRPSRPRHWPPSSP